MRIVCWLLPLILFTVTARAQVKAPEERSLSLEESIIVALDHNFGIQIDRFNPLIARYRLSGSYGVYDPVFSASGEHDYSLSPGGIDSQGRSFGGTESDTDRFSTGINGFLPWGMSYDLGGSLSDQSGNRPGTISDPNNFTLSTNTVYDVNTGTPTGFTLTTNFGTIPVRSAFETTSGSAGALTLRQPLLKNFWIDSPRYTIYVNRLGVKIADVNFHDGVMTLITSVEREYLGLMAADEQVKVDQKALELAEQLFAENKKRVEVGAMAPLDEKQAESQVASSRADLLKARADRDTQERRLKVLLTDDYTNQWLNVVITPTDKLVAVPQEYDLQESWRKALTQGPTLRQLRWGLDQNKRLVQLQRNQMYPELDLFGSYGYSGSSKEFSGALDQIRRQDSPFWSIGASVSIPLSQTSARNNLKIAKAERDQSALGLKAAVQDRLILIENDIGNARSFYERVQATREARQFAEAALEAEQKKLENGKSTSFEVLSLQSKLTDSRLAEIQALTSYNVSLAQLAFDEGSTLGRHHVELNEK